MRSAIGSLNDTNPMRDASFQASRSAERRAKRWPACEASARSQVLWVRPFPSIKGWAALISLTSPAAERAKARGG
jgi:hypothetical protein